MNQRSYRLVDCIYRIIINDRQCIKLILRVFVYLSGCVDEAKNVLSSFYDDSDITSDNSRRKYVCRLRKRNIFVIIQCGGKTYMFNSELDFNVPPNAVLSFTLRNPSFNFYQQNLKSGFDFYPDTYMKIVVQLSLIGTHSIAEDPSV